MRHSHKAIALMCMIMIGCTQMPTAPKGEPAGRIALKWEATDKPHPERAEWSDALTALIRQNLATYDKAADITKICPKYKDLSESGKIKAIGEFWVALSYFESGYSPTSASVDVGTADDKDTWSVGLFQMSVVDQANYKLPFGYKYADLLKPIPNITLAHAVMMKQIQNKSSILLKSGVYWAPLKIGGKYDHIDEIIARVKANAKECE